MHLSTKMSCKFADLLVCVTLKDVNADTISPTSSKIAGTSERCFPLLLQRNQLLGICLTIMWSRVSSGIKRIPSRSVCFRQQCRSHKGNPSCRCLTETAITATHHSPRPLPCKFRTKAPSVLIFSPVIWWPPCYCMSIFRLQLYIFCSVSSRQAKASRPPIQCPVHRHTWVDG